jgi:uncharacterized protein YraI
MAAAELTARRAFAMLVACVVLAAPLPFAGAAPAQSGYHYIVGLDPNGDNFLALRSAPDGGGRRIAELGPETLLAATGARSGRWLRVEVVNTTYAGLTGWVFDRYVACCSGAPTRPAASGTGRVEHPAGAPLNMRGGPSLDAPVIGSIPDGTTVPVYDCITESAARSWCSVLYRGRNGWVSTRYFIVY